jgi:hypothetical protein
MQLQRGRCSDLCVMMLFVSSSLGLSASAQEAHCPTQRVAAQRLGKETPRDNPRGQADWFVNDRRYPPMSRRLRTAAVSGSAAEKLREAFAENERAKGTRTAIQRASWNELGPKPQLNSVWGKVSGRVTSLALDPSDKSGNTVYVGTAFGGLWRCENGLSDPVLPNGAPSAAGQSASPNCKPLTDFQVTLSIGSIATSLENGSTVVYIGTGEANNSADSYYGQGILRSPDGGKSWGKPVYKDKQGHDFSGSAISKILVNPDKPQMLVAAATSASLADGRQVWLGVYVSQDGGKSWSLELGDGGVSDLVYVPTQKMYFAAVMGNGIYKRSLDSDKWEKVKSPFQCTNAITDTNFYRASLATRDGVLWALISDNRGEPSRPSDDDLGLVESRDWGDHWGPVQLPDGLFGGQGYYDQYLEAPPKSSQLIVGGIDVWSTDQIHGTSTEWNNLTNSYYGDVVHPDQHAIAPIDSERWYVGNDGGLWITNNAGGNWVNRNSSIGALQFVSVTPDPSVGNSYFGGSQDNGTAYGAGTGIPRWATSLGGDGGYTNVDDQHHYFAENYNVSLFYSDSSSGQWKPVVDGRTINERAAFYIPYEIVSGKETQVALGTFRVWLGPATPECAGGGWRPVSDDLTAGSGYITALATVPHSSGIVLVTSDSTVQRTSDISGQPTWTDIGNHDPNLPTGRAYSSVAVSPSDPETIYLGVMGFGTGAVGSGTGHVFKRIKAAGGFRWINITGNLKDVPVNSIVVDPVATDDVYVATDAGVWLTTDGGKEDSAWIPYGDGLPHSAVLQLKMTTKGKRMLVAATHGRGAWAISPMH